MGDGWRAAGGDKRARASLVGASARHERVCTGGGNASQRRSKRTRCRARRRRQEALSFGAEHPGFQGRGGPCARFCKGRQTQ
eukprot:7384786-Prymnesium_polylepis.2